MREIIISILISVVFINLLLSAIIFSRGLRTQVNVLFGLLSSGVGFWSVAILGFYFSGLPFHLNWVSWTHSMAVFIPLMFFYYCNVFPEPIIKNKLCLSAAFVPFLTLVILLFTGDYIIGATVGLRYTLNPGYVYYQLVIFSYFFFGFILLFLQFIKAKDQNRKKQISLILYGSLFSSMLAMITDLFFPYFGIFDYTWMGPIFTLILVFSIFTAILKHHLFDIKVIITEITTIIIISVLLIDVFLSSDYKGLIVRSAVLIIISIFSFLLIKGVYNEINQREKIEKLAKDLESANERLKELDQLKSEFVSLATHQIRGPLAAIKGYSSLMLEGDYGEIPKNLQSPIETVFTSSKSLAVIVDDFLNVSRIEQGKMKYDFSDFDLCDLVGEVTKEQKPNLDKKNLTLSSGICKGPLIINGDRGKIKQIVGNIIDNSVKYTLKGGITVTLEQIPERKKVRLIVKDTGVGIRPETIPHLFQKFSRAEDASKVNILGTGLGLYVAKEMVKAHDGKIWVESPGEGKGSSFFVELNTK